MGFGLTWYLVDAAVPTRPGLIRYGQQLEYFTIAYNSVEGVVSIVAGLIAGSASLVGFGLDSAIEVASGAALLLAFTSRPESIPA
jgi:divalent metal cation (Fe/Co/Zn/Cd) transporter